MSSKTKIISKEDFFTSEKFVVTKTIVEINGKQKTRYDVERKPTIAVFPISENGEIYLIREYRYLYKAYVLGCIAGFMEDDEDSPLATAKRELQEEAGLTAGKWEKLASVVMTRSVIKATSHAFVAQDITEVEAAREEDEDIAVVKVPIREAVEKVINGEIDSALSIIGILMIDKMLKEKKI